MSATGDIGTVKVVSEGSIGSNLRRIEAVTGSASVALLQRNEKELDEIAKLVSSPGDPTGGVQRKLDEIRSLNDEIKQLRAKLATGRATELAAGAVDGASWLASTGSIRRRSASWRSRCATRPTSRSRSSSARRRPAACRWRPRSRPGSPFEASALIKDAAKAVGGGGGGKGDVATAGGKDASGIDRGARDREGGGRRGLGGSPRPMRDVVP